MKNQFSNIVLFDAYYTNLDTDEILSKSTILSRKELKSYSNYEKLYQKVLTIPFSKDYSSYRISEISYHVGYQIMECESKYKWNFCIFVEPDKELNIAETYFTRESGVCDTETEALAQVRSIIQEFLNSTKEKSEE